MIYPGYIIPPRPKRNAVEGRRMSPEFLEDRRAALERYLNRLGAHPTLSRSEVGGRLREVMMTGMCVWVGDSGDAE